MIKYLLAFLLMFPATVTADDGVLDWYEAQGGEGGQFLLDTFTRTLDAVITAHTPETGGAWVKLNIVADQTFNVRQATDDVINLSSNGDVAYNDVSPVSADYTTTASVVVASTLSDRLAGPCVRVASTGSGYCATLGGTGLFIIREYADGGTSPYGTSGSPTAGLVSANYGPTGSNAFISTTEYNISLTASGSTLTATCELGSINVVDATVTDTGHPGFVIRRDTSKILDVEAQ